MREPADSSSPEHDKQTDAFSKAGRVATDENSAEPAGGFVESARSDQPITQTPESSSLEPADSPRAASVVSSLAPQSSSTLTLLTEVVEILKTQNFASASLRVIKQLFGENASTEFAIDAAMFRADTAPVQTVWNVSRDAIEPVIEDEFLQLVLDDAVDQSVQQDCPIHKYIDDDTDSHVTDSYSNVSSSRRFVLAIPLRSTSVIRGSIACTGHGGMDACLKTLKTVATVVEFRLRVELGQQSMESFLNDLIEMQHDLSSSDTSESITDSGNLSSSPSHNQFLPVYLDSPVPMLVVNNFGTIQHVSRYGLQSLRYAESDLIGKNVSVLYSSTTDADVAERLSLCRGETDQVHRKECGIRRGDGSWLQIRESLRVVSGTNNLFALVLQDITETYKRSRELEYRATHDGLTGLVNRVEFERRLEQAIRAVSLDGASHTLCYMDLDHFKGINDSSGHNAGDEILKQMARVFVRQIRQSDTIARLGGDEFAVLMEFCTLENAQRLAEDLRHAVEGFKFEWQGRSFSTSVSIGMTTIENADDLVSDVMARADAACYTAKSAGRNQISISDVAADIQKNSPEQRRILAIEGAIEQDSFEIDQQSAMPFGPVTERNKIINQLTLSLSRDGDRLSASRFMAAAVRGGLSRRIDEWMLIRVLEKLRADGGTNGDVYLLELSITTINDPGFPLHLKQMLNSYSIDPGALCLACSESVLATSQTAVENFIYEIHKLGSAFCINEFGSGFATFELIRDLNADYCKVDQSIVEKICQSHLDLAILSSIVNISNAANVQTIVGFLNDEQQLDLIHGLEIDFVQGDCIVSAVSFVADEERSDGSRLQKISTR